MTLAAFDLVRAHRRIAPELERRWREIALLSDRLGREEISAGLAQHRPPDPGFFAVAYAWAAGESFAEIVGDEELTGGDFVRTTKQLLDLLGQIARVAGPDTASTARRAHDAMRRDVVADTSGLST